MAEIRLNMQEVDFLVRALAARLVWVAPVGDMSSRRNGERTQVPLRGFMVCSRTVNNLDGKNTRVDYLQVGGGWKTPFTEERSLFPSMDAALVAAADALCLGFTPKQPAPHKMMNFEGEICDCDPLVDMMPSWSQHKYEYDQQPGTALTNFSPEKLENYHEAIRELGDPNLVIVLAPMLTTPGTEMYSLHSLHAVKRIPFSPIPFWDKLAEVQDRNKNQN
jgi:hypothetical protein